MNTLARMLKGDDVVEAFLEAIPCGVMVLDENRCIQALNKVVAKALGLPEASVIGKRIGEVIGCTYAPSQGEGPGLQDECQQCKARRFALAALFKGKKQRSRTSMQVSYGGAVCDVDLVLRAAPFQYQGRKLALIILEDIAKLAEIRYRHTGENPYQLIGQSAAMKEVFRAIRDVAGTDAPVLIEGETGTGKELVARAIHYQSRRAGKHFVAVNCAALPLGLLESELFGYVKGAFTGADRDKKGRFELADEGSILLDEIAELDMALQAKLLRVIQEGDFEPLGSVQTRSVDVRLVSATNRNLLEEVMAGRFRADIYYRLSVVPIRVPPLRDRLEDIPLLAVHLVSRFNKQHKYPICSLSPEVLSLLMERDWPGNVRELENVLHYALIKCRGKVILPAHLPPAYQRSVDSPPKNKSRPLKLSKELVTGALTREEGNKLKAARALGVSRSTLYRFMETKGDEKE
jgi:sigma-54 dependent transcriptional regulator, acetoin dehydrogenase operon transcriptional activator AcoR